MKILIAGTFCSGKTTLVNSLNSALVNSQVVVEPAGELVNHIKSLDWSSSEVRTYLIVRQILLENITEGKSPVVICDGGVESNLAHDKILTPGLNNIFLLEKLDHKKYDIVFFCDYSEIAFESNGLRITDLELQKQLSTEIHSMLLDLGYAPFMLVGGKNERLNQSLRFLLEKSIISIFDIEKSIFESLNI